MESKFRTRERNLKVRKEKSAPRLTSVKGGEKRKGEKVKFVQYEELDPDCAAFPLSAMARVINGPSNGTRCYSLRLGADAAVTTDGSGLLQTVYANIPSGAQNWSSFAATFDEYRILAFTVTFEPLWSTGGSTATYWAPIATVIDRSDATALTGYGLAERYESHKKAPGQKKWKQAYNMSSVDESDFVSTASPASNGWIKVYSSGNTASLTVGRVNIQWLLQFRGLGIN